MVSKISGLLALFMLVALASPVMPTTHAATNGQLMFILDASSSMLARDGSSQTRIEKAKAALNAAVDAAPADAALGLRAYGSQVPDSADKSQGCQDTKVLSRPASNNAAAIKSAVAGVEARGWTPIGKSLQAVKGDFSGEGPKTVILLSDGIDTCSPPDPCQVAKDLAGSGLKVKINTLGLTVDNTARQQLTCIANATGGEYFDVSNLDGLQGTLSALTAREANLFSTQGIPIQGQPRIEKAPLMLANTNYVDDIVAGEELFYAFDLKQGQKFKIVVTGDNTGGKFSPFDQLVTDWYRVNDSEKMNVGRDPKQFDNLQDDGPVPVILEGKAPASQKGTKRYAIKVNLDADTAGVPLPLELKLTTQGGIDPTNKNAANSKDAKKEDGSNLLVKLGMLAVLALLIGAIYAAYKFGAKRAAGATPTVATGGTDTPAVAEDNATPATDDVKPDTDKKSK